MNIEGIKALIALHHKPDLAKQDGMVYQVWEDGEVTLQKAGPLLWQRSLHMIEPPIYGAKVSGELFPMHLCNPGQKERHGYIFTDEAGCEAIRKALADMFGVFC
jgi:hypothetical protein